MCKYKGNDGNLMQHWTLCEMLTVAQRHTACLTYVDAHAMAPMASVRTERNDQRRQTFDRARDGRPGNSIYEQSWRRLDPRGQSYPNSAAFVQDAWKGRISMLLCEIEPTTAAALTNWAQDRPGVSVVEGDWRDTFERGLPDAPLTPADQHAAGAPPRAFERGLPDAPLTLLSFDPYMYSRHPRKRNPGNLYSSDLELVLHALSAVQGGVLVQLSTYAANDDNPQGSVISSANAILATGGFCLAAVVRVDGQMMSLVYVRGLDWSVELADLSGRFGEWLANLRRRETPRALRSYS